jgi:hypothetical protein
MLRPTAEEAIRTTITAIGTTDGRSPKTIPDWNLGSEIRKVSLPNSEKVNGNTHNIYDSPQEDRRESYESSTFLTS